MLNKRAQVWVETVIYTLIAFALIGIALALIKPQIESIQERAILDQTIILLNGIDSQIFDIVQKGEGNKRKLDITISRGNLIIDGENNRLLFELEESKKAYSEVGKNITSGEIKINTQEINDLYTVTLILDYSNKYNITIEGKEETKIVTPSPTQYQFFIDNQGKNSGTLTKINFEVV